MEFLAKVIKDSDRLQSMKPMMVKSDVGTEVSEVDGLLQITSMRYKNRIRKGQVRIFPSSSSSDFTLFTFQDVLDRDPGWDYRLGQS